MSRNNNNRNGSAKCSAMSAAETYHHPVLFDRFRKNGISSGRFPIHTSMNWENEVYDQKRVNASISVAMSSWNFGRITSFSGGRLANKRNIATENAIQVRNWLTAKMTGNIVEAHPGSSDITHCVAAAVIVSAKMMIPGPERFFNFSSAMSTFMLSLSS